MRSRVLVNLKADALTFFRSKSAVFWTLAFPILLMIIFGAIFGGMQDSTYSLYVQNLDEGEASSTLLDQLNSTGVLVINMVSPDVDADAFISENSIQSFMTIPANYTAGVTSGTSATLDLRLDQMSSSAGVITQVVGSVVDSTNLAIAGGHAVIGVETFNIMNDDFKYIDFFLPGVIGLMVMTVAVNSMVHTFVSHRDKGIFRKLTTTPMTRTEWLMSRVLWEIIIAMVSVTVIMITGILVFDVNATITPVSIALIVVGSAMFSALGMILAGLVKDSEGADAAASAITFPMMFLAGSFFPLESMPSYLQAVAKVLPLTYLNNGLRDAMIYDNVGGALMNLAVIAVLAMVFILIGGRITSWRVD